MSVIIVSDSSINCVTELYVDISVLYLSVVFESKIEPVNELYVDISVSYFSVIIISDSSIKMIFDKIEKIEKGNKMPWDRKVYFIIILFQNYK